MQALPTIADLERGNRPPRELGTIAGTVVRTELRSSGGIIPARVLMVIIRRDDGTIVALRLAGNLVRLFGDLERGDLVEVTGRPSVAKFSSHEVAHPLEVLAVDDLRLVSA